VNFYRMIFLHRHGLGITLVGLWLALLIVSLNLDPAGWWGQTMVNHAADTFGAALIVLATKHLYEKGSAESKDPDEDRS
jgi:uncharacterized membrane protein YdcZ (DUF606 family)